MHNHLLRLRRFVTEILVRERLFKDGAGWTQLCSCMDAVEDTDAAIAAFPGVARPKNTGQRYLAIYGVLQAMFVQQDAVRDMHEALGLEWKPCEIPELDRIRKCRNASIGHPTKQGSQGSPNHHFIIQISLTEDSFELLTRSHDGKTTTEHVRLGEFIRQQSTVIGETLARLLDGLQKDDREYRMSVSTQSLARVFDNQIHYAFEKLIGATRRSSPDPLGAWGLEHISRTLDCFEKQLKARGLDINSFPGVQIAWDETAYPIRQLQLFLGEKTDGVPPEAEAAYIFASFLDQKIRELEHMAQEIDSEFKCEDGK